VEHFLDHKILGSPSVNELGKHVLGVRVVFRSSQRLHQILEGGILSHHVAKLLITELPALEQGLGMKLLDLFIKECRESLTSGTGLPRDRYEGETAFLRVDLRTRLFTVVKTVDK
jgi:hypothetical protein